MIVYVFLNRPTPLLEGPGADLYRTVVFHILFIFEFSQTIFWAFFRTNQ